MAWQRPALSGNGRQHACDLPCAASRHFLWINAGSWAFALSAVLLRCEVLLPSLGMCYHGYCLTYCGTGFPLVAFVTCASGYWSLIFGLTEVPEMLPNVAMYETKRCVPWPPHATPCQTRMFVGYCMIVIRITTNICTHARHDSHPLFIPTDTHAHFYFIFAHKKLCSLCGIFHGQPACMRIAMAGCSLLSMPTHHPAPAHSR